MDFKQKLVIDPNNAEQTSEIDIAYRKAYHLTPLCQYVNSYGGFNIPTWFKREVIRVANGIYTMTDTLERLCKNHEAALMCVPHVSTVDPSAIAYTPTAHAGNEDKQLSTTFAKFAAKVNILFHESYIQSLEAEHRAELTATYHIATTPEDIMHVYTNMRGDSGCMRYEPHQWGLPADIHPSMVYAAPGMGVAYTTDEDGTIKSRSVIYADGEDKRYVRLYGDRVLEKLLKRDGYVCKSLEGLRLRKIPHPKYENTYVVPYIDGAGGDQNQAYQKAVYLDGDYLRVTSSNLQYRQLFNLSSDYVGTASHTGAKVVLKPVPDMEYVCALTGIKYNRLTSQAVKFLGYNGIVYVNKEHVDNTLYSDKMRIASMWPENDNVYYRGERSVFRAGGRTWFDTEEARLGLGQKRVTYGPEKGKWTSMPAAAIDAKLNVHVVELTTKQVTVLFADGKIDSMIAEEFDVYRKAHKFIRCPNIVENQEAYISPARSTMVRTNAGKAIDTQLHTDRYVKLYASETWASKRGAFEFSLYGTHGWLADGTDHFDYAAHAFENSRYYKAMSATRDVIANSIGTGVSLDTLASLRTKITQQFCYGILQSGGTMANGDTVVYNTNNITFESFVRTWAVYKEERDGEPWFAEPMRQSVSRIVHFLFDMMRDVDGAILRFEQQLAGQMTVEEGVAA